MKKVKRTWINRSLIKIPQRSLALSPSLPSCSKVANAMKVVFLLPVLSSSNLAALHCKLPVRKPLKMKASLNHLLKNMVSQTTNLLFSSKTVRLVVAFSIHRPVCRVSEAKISLNLLSYPDSVVMNLEQFSNPMFHHLEKGEAKLHPLQINLNSNKIQVNRQRNRLLIHLLSMIAMILYLSINKTNRLNSNHLLEGSLI
jgi:hypothetical protein